MKTTLTLIAGLIIGLIAGLLLSPLFNKEPIREVKEVESIATENSSRADNPIRELSSRASGITRENAWRMFDDYHGVTHSNSNVCMTTTVRDGDGTAEKNIEAIFLEYDGFLAVIKDRVEDENEIFLGLAGIPVYNSHPDTLSHTMIWVPVVEGANSRPEYFIPQENETQFIFEYVGICPEFCPDNRCDIWKRDWDVTATCTVNF